MTSKHKFQPMALILAALVLMLASLACGSDVKPVLVATQGAQADTGSQQPNQPADAPAVQQSYKVGDVVALGDHTLVVLGWENVQPNDFSKPDAGKKFVAVELLIVNNSQSPMSVSTLMQMSMKDATGQKYNTDFMASTAANGSSLDGELAPGEKVRGKVGFQIAENAQGLQFVFDASVFGTGKVFIDLGAQPVAVEPPASIAGETSQQTYQVGDVIAMGTTTLIVNQVLYPTGDQFNKPKEGNKFLVVDLTLENKGAQAIAVSTLMQMSLKDTGSQKYAVDLMASMASGGSSPDGEIAPGEKVRGQVGFQVPTAATGLVFIFDADVWGTGKAFVALP